MSEIKTLNYSAANRSLSVNGQRIPGKWVNAIREFDMSGPLELVFTPQFESEGEALVWMSPDGSLSCTWERGACAVDATYHAHRPTVEDFVIACNCGASFGFWTEWVDHVEGRVARASSVEAVVL